jgi:quercetin dioxygenase-like cupin family protein
MFGHDSAMKKNIGLSVGFFLLGAFVVFGQKAAQSVVRVTPEQLKWVDEPDGLGFKTAVVEGDPSKPGVYAIQVKFPPGVMSRPHSHREDRYATVLKGTWYTGEGNEFAPDKTVPLKPGSFMKHPAGTNHYDGAKTEEVILQLVGIGPSQTTRVRPELGLFGRSMGKDAGK